MREDIAMTAATIKAVRDFFNEDSVRPMSVKEFSTEWNQLTEDEKEQIKTGIGNGTLTY